jgi:glycine/D-amino acid oxidase-like deaminating enzyme
MERAVDTTRELITSLGIDCDYEHPGFLRVATSEKYRTRLLHEFEVAQSLGLDGIEWLDREQTRREVASPLYLGAWWEPRCGLLNPAKLSWGWRDVVEAEGVRIFERTPVTELARQGSKVRLVTPRGRVLADSVVLATNAYSHLIPQLKRKQVPAWTHIVLTEPIDPARMAELGWQRRQGIEDARNLVHYYRLTADNRLLMGGRDVSIRYGRDMDGDLNQATFAELEQDVVETFPALAGLADQPPLGRAGVGDGRHGARGRLPRRPPHRLQPRLHRPRRQHDPPQRADRRRPRARPHLRAHRGLLCQPPHHPVAARADPPPDDGRHPRLHALGAPLRPPRER